jgi:hypothetical protein
MEWLEADVAHYRYFMYGVEGVDYGNVDGEYIDLSVLAPPNGLCTSYFRKSGYDSALYTNYYEINGYPQEFLTTAVSYPAEITLLHEIGAILAYDMDYHNAHREYLSIFRTMQQDLSGRLSENEMHHIIRSAFDALRNLEHLDLAERLIKVKMK